MGEKKKTQKPKLLALALLSIFTVSFIAAWYLIPEFKDFFDGPNREDEGEKCFDPGDRYQSNLLNYMNVIYTNRSNITGVMETYSNTVNCPWGFIHEGFDFFFANHSKVIAAAPGQVIRVDYTDSGENIGNRYCVGVAIQFNCTTIVGYGFEPWTNETENWLLQQSMISVKVGDWVEIGQEIGQMLVIGNAAHIHFEVIENDNKPCLTKYYSEAGYQEIMNLIHIFHPTWELCYVE
jgi:hypothetical protein